ncbi:MAG: hypothetical protein QOE70_6477 [Chthoniobacter sp.]|nr:hypothetical protein [Chthoniobacter sp.]
MFPIRGGQARTTTQVRTTVRPPVLIAGMHRSGTSMVTRLLKISGLYLGRDADLGDVARDNRSAVWEDTKFVALNDEILEQLGGRWDSPPQLQDGWEDEEPIARLRVKAEMAFQEFFPHAFWGWNDPRNSLTLPFWRHLFPRGKVVIPLRNPLEVALSLHRRHGTSYALGLQLWQAYNQRVLEWSRSEDRIITHYDSYFRSPHAELRRVLNFLQAAARDVEAACASVIGGLRHAHFSTDHLLDAGVAPEVFELYRAMCVEAQWQDEPRGRHDVSPCPPTPGSILRQIEPPPAAPSSVASPANGSERDSAMDDLQLTSGSGGRSDKPASEAELLRRGVEVLQDEVARRAQRIAELQSAVVRVAELESALGRSRQPIAEDEALRQRAADLVEFKIAIAREIREAGAAGGAEREWRHPLQELTEVHRLAEQELVEVQQRLENQALLQKRIAELAAARGGLQGELSHVHAQVESEAVLQVRITELNKRNGELEAEIARLQQSLGARENLADAADRKSGETREVASVPRQLAELQQARDRIERDLAIAHAQLSGEATLRSKITWLTDRNRQLLEQLSQLDDSVSEHAEAAKVLRSLLNDKTLELREQLEAVGLKSAELDQALEARQLLEAQLVDSQATRRQMEAELQEARAALQAETELHSRIGGLTDANFHLGGQAAQLHQAIAEHAQAAGELRAVIAAKNSSEAQLREQIASLDQQGAELRLQLEDQLRLRARLAELESELNDARIHLDGEAKLHSRIGGLTDANFHLERQVAQLRQAIADNARAAGELHEIIAGKNAFEAQLRGQLASLDQQGAELRRQLDEQARLQARLAELESELNDARRRLDGETELHSRIGGLTDANLHLQGHAAQLRQAIADYARAAGESQEIIAAKNALETHLREQMALLDQQGAELRLRLDGEAELHSRIGGLTDANLHLQGQAAQLRQAIADYAQAAGASQEIIAGKNALEAHLREQMALLDQQGAELRLQLEDQARLQARLAELESELNDARLRLHGEAELHSRIGGLTDANFHLEGQAAQLRQAIAAHAQAAGELHDVIAGKNAFEAQLRAQIASLDQQGAELRLQLDDQARQQARLAELESELNEARTHLRGEAELHSRIGGLTDANFHLKAETVQLREFIAGHALVAGELRDIIAGKSAVETQLREQIADLDEQSAELRQRLEDQAPLHARLAELQGINDQVVKELAAARAELAGEALLRGQIGALTQRSQQLEQKIAELHEAIADRADVLRRLEEVTVEKGANEVRLAERAAGLQKRIDELTSRSQHVEGAMRDLLDQNQTQHRQIRQLREENDTLTSAQVELEAQYFKLEADTQTRQWALETDLAEVAASEQSLTRKAAELETTLARLSKREASLRAMLIDTTEQLCERDEALQSGLVTIRRLNADEAVLHDRIGNLTHRLELAQNEIASLRDSLHQAGSQAAAAERQRHELQTEKDIAVQRLNEEQTILHSRIGELTHRNEGMEQELHRAHGERAALSGVEERLAQVIKGREAMEAELGRAQGEIAHLAKFQVQLRKLLLEAHEQLLRRDEELQGAMAGATWTATADSAAPEGPAPTPAVPSKYFQYQNQIRELREIVHNQLPAETTLLVVSKGDRELVRFDNRTAWHFLQAENGNYAGHHPADDATCIAHLEAQRARGAQFLLFPSTAFWWLEHYAVFHRYLGTHAQLIIDESAGKVFGLTGEAVEKKRRYADLIGRVREAAQAAIPEGARLAVASKGDPHLIDLSGREALHFPRAADGRYAGHHPENSALCIEELARNYREGVRYFLLPATMFWWLGFYEQFAACLTDQARLVFESEHCRIYELLDPAPSPRIVTEEPAPVRTVPYRGHVATVDAPEKTFTFIGKGGKRRVFSVTEDTFIRKGNRKVSLKAVVVGAHVSGQYRQSADGQIQAVSVILQPVPDARSTPR